MKILIFYNSALGDFITFLPFLKLLIFNYQDVKIELFTKKKFFTFLKNYQQVIVKDIETLPLFMLFAKNEKRDNFNFLEKFDQIISFIGVENKDFRTNILKLNRNSYFIFPHNRYEKIHQIFYLLNSYPFVKKRIFYPNIKLKKKKKKFFIIHPGSGSKIKNISLNFLHEIEKKIKKTFNLQSVWIGGEAEEYLKEKVKKIKFIYSNEELLDCLSSAYFYIGNDSGVSHVAAGCDILTFTFFGPTSPEVWAPIGEKSIVFYKDLSCSPCNSKCFNRECLEFDLNFVENKIVKIIEQELTPCPI